MSVIGKFACGAVAVGAIALHATSANADPADTVVVCHLTSETFYNSAQDFSPRTTKIDEEFVLKFNDTQKRVTYVAGDAVTVKPACLPEPYTARRECDDFVNFENRIVFLGDSWVPLTDGLRARYSGDINRLTGKIELYERYVDPKYADTPSVNDPKAEARPYQMKQGTCVAGPRKF